MCTAQAAPFTDVLEVPAMPSALASSSALPRPDERLGDWVQRLQRLTLANLRNDGAAIDEVVALIEPLAESWKAIRAQAIQGA